MNELSSLAAFYRDGGPFMHFILATAVVGAAIAVERFIVIQRAAGLNGRRLVDDLVQHVTRGDLAGGRNLCRASDAPVARVASTMLQVGGSDPSRLQSAAEDAALLALAPLSRRLAHLNLLANVATLLGLLGTITGLITAFAAVGAADPAQRSAFLAAGISTALNTTAFGLIVAVPGLLVQGYLTGLVEGLGDQVDETIIRLGQALGRAESPAGRIVAMPGAAARPAVAPVRGPAAAGGAQ